MTCYFSNLYCNVNLYSIIKMGNRKKLLKELDTGFVLTGEHMDFENQKTHQHTDYGHYVAYTKTC